MMTIKTQILAIPSLLATQMLGLEHHGQAHTILNREMTQLLTNLATIDAVREAAEIEERGSE
jgi:hypothetical protein